MMNYSDLLKIISESSILPPEKPVVRDYEEKLKTTIESKRPIKVLTGLRRSGKSYLFKRLYTYLKEEKKIPWQNLFFLNFENERLTGFLNVEKLRELFETFWQKRDKNASFYIFWDEIQNIPHWEKLVRTLYDNQNANIYLTGSNSKLLSGEIADVLGGRVLEMEIYPFSFKEYLDALQVKYQNEMDKIENKDSIMNALEEYLEWGGIAEQTGLKLPEQKISFRQSLIEKIIINDILERYKIDNPGLLRSLLSFLEKDTGQTVSNRNLSNTAGKDEKTIKSYLEYLGNTYLLFPVEKYQIKTKQILFETRKYYFSDNIFNHNADIEDRLENTIYIELCRRFGRKNVYFGRDERGREVDFVVIKQDGSMSAFQVCYKLNEKNIKRELSGLTLFQKYQEIKKIEEKVIYFSDERKKKKKEKWEMKRAVDFLLE